MRSPLPTDFFVDVDQLGTFRFAKRKMSDEIAIQRLYSEYTGGVTPTVWLLTLGEYLSTIRALLVESPDGWDIDNLDPLEDETYEQIGRVFVALREREETFRKGAGEKRKAPRAKDAKHRGSVVSPDLQATD
jgi:hypothetical protein